ncbi:GTP 3',8-cyclase MoaA [Alicyclobacillus herbarius]|uniref:GTP 3',8-cyclase MoaA n=1 Tax=Alicyclobacillus herbarius TaxID=122960 RepID=UPI0023556ADA|nr:GTP 3',8-cyclase MoaA [Alicyclobacillus herbarius]
MRVSLTDALKRPLRDLRISVTDRCNFRCRYCMPKEVFGPDFAFLQRSDLLTFEEIARFAGLAARLGVHKFRLTGGEPLLRRGLEDLIAHLARVEGVDDIAMTTNGSLLSKERARALKDAGLKRITISLDSLDDAVFMSMNDVHFPVAKVLAAIDNAQAAGLAPVKVNMVVRRGWNEDSILPMADYFRGSGCILRFIEYMDVGNSNGWKMDDVVPASEILERIGQRWPLEPVPPRTPGEVATRYRYVDGQGEIGVISSVTRPFCGQCTRLRLSAEGRLYTCLFAARGFDIRSLMRAGATDEELLEAIGQVWGKRTDRYSELRTDATAKTVRRKVEMSHIGG